MPQPEPVEQAPVAAPAPEVTETAPPEVTATAETQGDSIGYDDIQDVSADDAMAFFKQGKALELPDKAAPTEAEKAPVETVLETPVDPAPEIDLERPMPNRIPTSQFDDREQKALNLMHVVNAGKKPGDAGRIGIADALAQLDSMEGKGKATEPPAPSPVETITSKVTEAEAALATLRQQKKDAVEFGADTSEIEEQIEAARDAIGKENIRLAIAEDRAQRQQAQEVAAKTQTAQELRNASHAEAIKDFPDMVKEGSAIRTAILQAIEERKDPHHFDHALLEAPEAPQHVLTAGLKILAKKDGISFAQAVLKYGAPAPVVAPTVTKPAPVQPKKALPASGSQATTQPRGTPTIAEVIAEVGDDPDKAWEAIHGANKRTYLK